MERNFTDQSEAVNPNRMPETQSVEPVENPATAVERIMADYANVPGKWPEAAMRAVEDVVWEERLGPNYR